MSDKRYEDLVAMGAPELKPGWRYRIMSDDKSQMFFVSVEERVYRRRWLRGTQPQWKRIGREYIVGALVDGPYDDLEKWESVLVRSCTAAAESAERERTYREMRNKWEGGQP